MTPADRSTPALSALRYHGARCSTCQAAVKAGMSITEVCGAAWILARKVLMPRARRTVRA